MFVFLIAQVLREILNYLISYKEKDLLKNKNTIGRVFNKKLFRKSPDSLYFPVNKGE